MAIIYIPCYGVLSTNTVDDIFDTPSGQWALTERQQFLFLYIWYSRHRADISDHHRTTERLRSPKYKTQMEKHWFWSHQYSNLQSIQTVIIGCWISEFDQILLSNSKIQRSIWMYTQTRWTTRWQPAQFGWDGIFPSDHMQSVDYGILTTWTAGLGKVWFRSGPRPEATVRNCS